MIAWKVAWADGVLSKVLLFMVEAPGAMTEGGPVGIGTIEEKRRNKMSGMPSRYHHHHHHHHVFFFILFYIFLFLFLLIPSQFSSIHSIILILFPFHFLISFSYFFYDSYFAFARWPTEGPFSFNLLRFVDFKDFVLIPTSGSSYRSWSSIISYTLLSLSSFFYFPSSRLPQWSRNHPSLPIHL